MTISSLKFIVNDEIFDLTQKVDGSGNVVVSLGLKPTGVSQGTAINATSTVDMYGRVLKSEDGTQSGTVSSVAIDSDTLDIVGSPITENGDIQINIPDSGVTGGLYKYPQNMQITDQGIISSVEEGAAAGLISGYSVLDYGYAPININNKKLTVINSIYLSKNSIVLIQPLNFNGQILNPNYLNCSFDFNKKNINVTANNQTNILGYCYVILGIASSLSLTLSSKSVGVVAVKKVTLESDVEFISCPLVTETSVVLLSNSTSVKSPLLLQSEGSGLPVLPGEGFSVCANTGDVINYIVLDTKKPFEQNVFLYFSGSDQIVAKEQGDISLPYVDEYQDIFCFGSVCGGVDQSMPVEVKMIARNVSNGSSFFSSSALALGVTFDLNKQILPFTNFNYLCVLKC